MTDPFLQDLRFAIRTLSRRPAFAVGAVLTLALGIGANAAVFGLVDAVLLRTPEGVASPDRLVALYTSDYSGPAYGTSSYPDFLDVSSHDAFTGMAAWTNANLGLTTDGRIEAVRGLAVSASYFDVLGTVPAAGRFFRPEEEAAAGDIVVVSHAFWQREMGGSRSAVGRTLRVNGQPLEVVGVVPPGFVGFDRQDEPALWLPTRTAARIGALFGDYDRRDNRGHSVVARLAPGVSVAQAAEAMRNAAQRLSTIDPAAWTDVRGDIRRITVLPERRVRVPPDARGTALGLAGVLAGAAALVLLLCCANVAGLLLARATGRQREIGIRLSLGAGRQRLIRQLLTESFVLALLGGVGGLLLALWGSDVLAGAADLRAAIGVPIELRADFRFVGFAAAVSCTTAVLFGLAPALRASRVDVARTLRAESAGSTAGARTLGRSLLVGAQIAVSVVLLVGALLLVRTLRAAYAADPGFATEHVLLASARPAPGADDAVGRTALLLRDRLASLPGVESAGWGWYAPLQGGAPRRGSTVEGHQPGPGEDMGIYVDHVGPGFFGTLGIPIRAGRAISSADDDAAPRVAVINEAFVRRYWPDRDPIGLRIEQGDDAFTVVGVAADVRFLSATRETPPLVYLSALQIPRATTFFIRTAGDAARVIPAIRAVFTEVAPGWSISALRTMDEQRGRTLGGQRLAGGAIGLFALLALVLACVGLYGVIAFAVARRAREVGVRIALGAKPREVVALFLRQATPIIGGGALVGLVLALAATRALRSLLIGIAPTDAVSFTSATAVLVAVALFATWWPARRASRVDPIAALRAE